MTGHEAGHKGVWGGHEDGHEDSRRAAAAAAGHGGARGAGAGRRLRRRAPPFPRVEGGEVSRVVGPGGSQLRTYPPEPEEDEWLQRAVVRSAGARAARDPRSAADGRAAR